jgi:hypothetical protein
VNDIAASPTYDGLPEPGKYVQASSETPPSDRFHGKRGIVLPGAAKLGAWVLFPDIVNGRSVEVDVPLENIIVVPGLFSKDSGVEIIERKEAEFAQQQKRQEKVARDRLTQWNPRFRRDLDAEIASVWSRWGVAKRAETLQKAVETLQKAVDLRLASVPEAGLEGVLNQVTRRPFQRLARVTALLPAFLRGDANPKLCMDMHEFEAYAYNSVFQLKGHPQKKPLEVRLARAMAGAICADIRVGIIDTLRDVLEKRRATSPSTDRKGGQGSRGVWPIVRRTEKKREKNVGDVPKPSPDVPKPSSMISFVSSFGL